MLIYFLLYSTTAALTYSFTGSTLTISGFSPGGIEITTTCFSFLWFFVSTVYRVVRKFSVDFMETISTSLRIGIAAFSIVSLTKVPVSPPDSISSVRSVGGLARGASLGPDGLTTLVTSLMIGGLNAPLLLVRVTYWRVFLIYVTNLYSLVSLSSVI